MKLHLLAELADTYRDSSSLSGLSGYGIVALKKGPGATRRGPAPVSGSVSSLYCPKSGARLRGKMKTTADFPERLRRNENV